MEIHKFDVIQSTDDEFGVVYLGAHVDPDTYQDQAPGVRFGVPRDHIRGMWLRPVSAMSPDGSVQGATALAGITEEGHHFAFDIQPVQSFAPIVLN